MNCKSAVLSFLSPLRMLFKGNELLHIGLVIIREVHVKPVKFIPSPPYVCLETTQRIGVHFLIVHRLKQ